MQPQIPTTHMPNLQSVLPNPETPWLISPGVYQRIQTTGNAGSYQKCEIKPSDPEWTFIQRYFEHQKPTNRSIKKAYCIHNPSATRQFEAAIPSLEIEAGKPIFSPKWPQEDHPQLRQKVIERWKTLTAPYSPFSISWANQRKDTYRNVKILPLWHGTKAAVCESICDTGFTFFGKQDIVQGGIKR